MKIIRDESGQTLVMVALSFAVLLGFAAFATDVGVLLHEKRTAQTAADSAAIAGAKAMNEGATSANANLVGEADATLNGFTDGQNGATVAVTVDPSDNPNPAFNAPGFVEAKISVTTPTPLISGFIHLLNPGSTYAGMTVGARAVATYIGNPSANCMTVLNKNNNDPAGQPWGNSSIFATGCGIVFNGNLVLGASDSVNAGFVGTTGTITGVGDINGTYQTGIPPVSDPLANLSLATSLPTINGTTCSVSDGSACFLNIPMTSTSPSGTYYYTIPADATFTGNVNITGTIILTNGSILSTSGGSGKGNATITVTSPSSGPYAGIAVDAPNYTGELALDFGATTAKFNGAVYAPLADLSLQDQGGSTKSGSGSGVTVCGDLVLGTLDVNDKNKGNLSLCPQGSGGGGLALTKITLVQ